MNPDKYITLAGLKERKWTSGAITKFLGEPDKLKSNPFYRKAPQMRLYLIERVEAAEQSADFLAWKNKTKGTREKQSKRQLEIAAEKRKQIIDYIASLDFKIPIFERSELFSKAVKHYNRLWSRRGRDKCADLDSDEDFLIRISVNMLRHQFSSYENQLDHIFGKVGVLDAYVLLKNRILTEIGRIYPYLSRECEKQKVEKL